ncbi:sugar ABC transporter ATP-binding protein [Clostridia bacterium]|nr:sugar ABC transporter ATP-binding protein [Clostridia bacterium]
MQPVVKHKGVSYAKYGYLFSLPFMLAFLTFTLYPILYTAILGFTDLNGVATTSFSFLEDTFANFRVILNNATFQKSFKNTVIIWVINFVPQILLATLIAYWFTGRGRQIRGQGFFKVMFYMPNIITAASVAILFAALFGYPIGPVNSVLTGVKLLGTPFNFASSPWAAKLIVAFIQFWMWYGYTAIILMSGVLGINPELFESAEIDGASQGQCFWKITLPCLRTIILFTLITSLIGGLNMFDIPKLFANGGPVNETSTVSVFIYNQAFSGKYWYNRAAAASMIMFVLIVALSAIVFYLMRDRYESRLKKDAHKANRAARLSAKGVI